MYGYVYVRLPVQIFPSKFALNFACAPVPKKNQDVARYVVLRIPPIIHL